MLKGFNVLSKVMVIGVALSAALFASTQTSTIDKINFSGNEKIPAKKLSKIVQPYIGTPLDPHHSGAIAKEIEEYYHKNNFALTYASVEKVDEANHSVLIRIGKYRDFDDQAIGEMKRREIKPGMINKIFFDGNEKISTQRLMSLAQPSLGLEKNQKNLDEIVRNVQDYYRNHRYELAYAEVANVDENGTVTIDIKKYPSYKARYAREGKN